MKNLLLVALLGMTSAFAGEINEINEHTFGNQTGSGIVLVDFYADWCGPCKRLGPVLEMVDDEIGNKVKIFKVNIDRSPNLAERYEVRGVPTLVLFNNGEEKGTLVGFHDKTAIKKFIESEK